MHCICLCMHVSQIRVHSMTKTRFITVPLPQEVRPELSPSVATSPANIMDQFIQFSNFISQPGEVSDLFCERCSINGHLCIVSSFATCCGLCARAGVVCSLHVPFRSQIPNHPIMSTSEEYQLRVDLSRVTRVLNVISEGLAPASFVGGRGEHSRTLESCQDNKG